MQRCDHKEGPWEHEGAVGTLANGRLCRYKEVPRHHRYSSRHVIYTCCGRRGGGEVEHETQIQSVLSEVSRLSASSVRFYHKTSVFHGTFLSDGANLRTTVDWCVR